MNWIANGKTGWDMRPSGGFWNDEIAETECGVSLS